MQQQPNEKNTTTYLIIEMTKTYVCCTYTVDGIFYLHGRPKPHSYIPPLPSKETEREREKARAKKRITENSFTTKNKIKS